MQATLPEELERKTLRDGLLFYGKVYCVPWAMVVDKRGGLWIDLDAPFTVKPSGTFKMEVSFKGHMICDVRNVTDYLWSRTERVSGGNLVTINELVTLEKG